MQEWSMKGIFGISFIILIFTSLTLATDPPQPKKLDKVERPDQEKKTPEKEDSFSNLDFATYSTSTSDL